MDVGHRFLLGLLMRLVDAWMVSHLRIAAIKFFQPSIQVNVAAGSSLGNASLQCFIVNKCFTLETHSSPHITPASGFAKKLA